MEPTLETYEFIVVGSGPAGCTVASRLANSTNKPSVLLLEAGGENVDRDHRVDGQRWLTFRNEDMNWGYKTAPQENCGNRVIDYSRGRGLGGSSAINFGAFTFSCRDDYDQWAQIVGDDSFNWEHMQSRLKDLENFHIEAIDKDKRKYVGPEPCNHGAKGSLHVGYAAEWERETFHMVDLFERAGYSINPDHNSGNPLGISLVINSAHRGLRTTAADLLNDNCGNLKVLTYTTVQRLCLEDKRVVGVESNGRMYTASKEVILCAGALDTPKILMLSGIGPSEQLQKHGIQIIQDTPAVGRGLQDHIFCPFVYTVKEGITDRGSFYGSQEAMDAAMAQWRKDGTGPWATFGCQAGMAFFKSDRITSSDEFRDLPAETQNFLQRETVPHYEVFTSFPAHWFMPGLPKAYNYVSLVIMLMNGQSEGEVTLQSSDPNVPLRFDPKILSHPFDRRAVIEVFRDLSTLVEHPSSFLDAPLAGPRSNSDGDILDYWKQTTSSCWHMAGTVKMGGHNAAVDNKFRVRGIDRLRVADMSVTPILVNNHPQATAYAIGLTCAETLIDEYNLG